MTHTWDHADHDPTSHLEAASPPQPRAHPLSDCIDASQRPAAVSISHGWR